MDIEDALKLEPGELEIDFGGIPVQRIITPAELREGAQALKGAKVIGDFKTQASIVVKAQELHLAFTDWVGKAVVRHQ